MCYHIIWYSFSILPWNCNKTVYPPLVACARSGCACLRSHSLTHSSFLFSNSIKWHSILPLLLLLLFCFKFNFYRYLMSFVAEPCWHTSYTHRWWSHSLSLPFPLSVCWVFFSVVLILFLLLFSHQWNYPYSNALVRQHTGWNALFLFKGYALPSLWYVPNNCFWLYLNRNHVIDLLCCFRYDQFSWSFSSLLFVVAVVSNLHR